MRALVRSATQILEMLTLVGINPTTMTVQQYDTILMYVNAINAKKFR